MFLPECFAKGSRLCAGRGGKELCSPMVGGRKPSQALFQQYCVDIPCLWFGRVVAFTGQEQHLVVKVAYLGICMPHIVNTLLWCTLMVRRADGLDSERCLFQHYKLLAMYGYEMVRGSILRRHPSLPRFSCAMH